MQHKLKLTKICATIFISSCVLASGYFAYTYQQRQSLKAQCISGYQRFENVVVEAVTNPSIKHAQILSKEIEQLQSISQVCKDVKGIEAQKTNPLEYVVAKACLDLEYDKMLKGYKAMYFLGDENFKVAHEAIDKWDRASRGCKTRAMFFKIWASELKRNNK